MRPISVSVLFMVSLAGAQTVPPGWRTVQDGKGVCRISVPPDWTSFSESSGAAVFRDATTAIAVVTSQPGQTFKQLSDAQLKTLGIGKEKIFENSAKRLFYQDRTAENAEAANAYSTMVPGRNGTCSCHIVFTRDVTDENARKIALSVGPVPDQKSDDGSRSGSRGSDSSGR